MEISKSEGHCLYTFDALGHTQSHWPTQEDIADPLSAKKGEEDCLAGNNKKWKEFLEEQAEEFKTVKLAPVAEDEPKPKSKITTAKKNNNKAMMTTVIKVLKSSCWKMMRRRNFATKCTKKITAKDTALCSTATITANNNKNNNKNKGEKSSTKSTAPIELHSSEMKNPGKLTGRLGGWVPLGGGQDIFITSHPFFGGLP